MTASTTDPLAPFRAAASPEQRAACDELDMLDPETPEAAIEEQARALGLDPDALLRRGKEIGRSLRSAAEELTAERLDELDRWARDAAERASKATAGPWRAKSGCVLPPDGVDRGPEKALLDPEILVAAGTARECEVNSAFAAHAREDVPALSAAVLALSAEVRRLRRASTTIEGIECTVRIASLALSEPDPEDDCLRCHRTMRRADPSDERTPLCHYCAQAVLPTLAMLVQQLGGKNSGQP